MALITTRAYLVAVFDPGSTQNQRTNATNQMNAKLTAAGFTGIDTYELIDAIVNTTNNGPKIVDLVISRVKGVT